MLCQRQHSVLISTVDPREMSELEGSLLDPNSLLSRPKPLRLKRSVTHPGDDGDDDMSSVYSPVGATALVSPISGTELAATPSQYFQYNHDDDDAGRDLDEDIPITLSSLHYDDNTPAAHAISTAAKAKLGSNTGRINAMEELEKIKAINRLAKAKPYHDKARIEAGQEVAKQRVRQGFDVKDNNYSSAELLEGKEVFVEETGSFVSGKGWWASSFRI
jgi:hypothetical protein